MNIANCRINRQVIAEVLGARLEGDDQFLNLGGLTSELPATLSFIESPRFLPMLHTNPNITGVFLTASLRPHLRAQSAIVCEDPRHAFYKLYNWRAARDYVKRSNVIAPGVSIHPSAYVAEHNIVIGADTVIEARAVVLPDVVVGANCVIGVNSVVGCDDAELKRTSQGLLKVTHDGRLVIGDRVEIGANCTLDKGFHGRDTEIGCGTKLANCTYIGHSVRVGRDCMLLACTLLGSSVIGDEVRINPGAVISNQVVVESRAEISLGAIVVQNVKSGSRVSGNFALEHRRFLYRYSKLFGPL